MRARIGIFIPMKPNLQPVLINRCLANVSDMLAGNPDHDLFLVIDRSGSGDHGVKTLAERVARNAGFRQAMVDRHLTGLDYVLWIDADIIYCHPGLPTLLVERNPSGISAPFNYLAGEAGRFYDTAGFVHNNRCFNILPPYYQGQEPGHDHSLDGVGCVYMVNANIYRDGAKHEPDLTFTEHLSVCRHAREMGLRVCAYSDIAAYHADLRHYGEAMH